MLRVRYPWFYLIALLIFTETSRADNITNVNVSVQLPARLSLGERITVSFNYSTNYTKGVRIFVRPMTNGALSPDYSAHPSMTYYERNGHASGFFTISKGNVKVDKIQIKIVSTDDTVLFTKIVPAELQFSDSPYLLEPKTQSVAAGIKRNILPDGNVEISYPDGSKKILFDGGVIIIDPDGGEQRFYFMSVQIATPPMLPDQQPIIDWLNAINDHLLSTIRSLVDKNEMAINYYLKKENDATTNLYERMRLRTHYIDRLLTRQ